MKIYNDDIFDIYTTDNFAHHRRTYIYISLMMMIGLVTSVSIFIMLT